MRDPERTLPTAGLGVLALSLLVSCAQPVPEQPHAALGPFLDSLMVAHEIPGLSFALFDNTGVLYEAVRGVKRAGTTDSVTAGTVFEAASISKAVTAAVTLSLVQQGVFTLDTPIAELVDAVPELAYDPRSAQLTPRLLLTHQGGLPNWRSRMQFGAQTFADMFPDGDTLRFETAPGTRHRYSGEGYLVLQRAMETHLGSSLNALALERVFGPLQMTRSSFRFDDAMQTDYAMGHNAAGEPNKFDIQLALASTSLHSTGADLGRFGFWLAQVIGDAGPYAGMGQPAVAAAPPRDSTETGVRSWGLGLGIVDAGEQRYIYHSGNNVVYIADLMYGIEENIGYALLTNSANGQRVVDALEARLFGGKIR